MAWPKGQSRPDAFKRKEGAVPSSTYGNMVADGVISNIKEILKTYNHDLRVEIIEQSNKVRSVEITALIRFP